LRKLRKLDYVVVVVWRGEEKEEGVCSLIFAEARMRELELILHAMKGLKVVD
jgi:hypothetical protein